jgi:hypothetical protein
MVCGVEAAAYKWRERLAWYQGWIWWILCTSCTDNYQLGSFIFWLGQLSVWFTFCSIPLRWTRKVRELTRNSIAPSSLNLCISHSASLTFPPTTSIHGKGFERCFLPRVRRRVYYHLFFLLCLNSPAAGLLIS